MDLYFKHEAHVKTGNLKLGNRRYKVFYHQELQSLECDSLIFQVAADSTTLISANINKIEHRLGFREATHVYAVFRIPCVYI